MGSISNKVGNLTLVKELYLDRNNLTGVLPEEIGNLNLEIFFYSRNNLSGRIPSQIFNMSAVKIIGLHHNQFTGQLPSTTGLWLPNLEELYLNSNRFSGPIPSSLANASKITIIELTRNSFSGIIPNTLGELRHLKILHLSVNNLVGEADTPELRFVSSLTNCRDLQALRFYQNQLNGILPASFGNLSTSLQIIEAFGSEIKGDIPVGIGNLSSLMAINIDDNELTGVLPTSLGRLTQLQKLYLRQNRLEGSIPVEICMLSSLGDLILNDNKLNDSIPPCIGQLGSLKLLYLASNMLSSTIPSTLWRLNDLVGLNLSTNLLSGSLPTDIGNFKVISEMDLSWNQLQGHIPSTIGGAQMLSILSFAGNQLQGSIPQSLGTLINLVSLNLLNKMLSGELPKSLEKLRYLQYFDVSVNELEGEVPTGGNFPNFTAIKNDGLCGAPRLQLHPCKSRIPESLRLKILAILALTIGAIIVVILIFLLRRRRKTKPRSEEDSSPTGWMRVSYHQLLQATNAFTESNLLGKGSIGSVYKGTLTNGMHIAVKVFNLDVEGAFKSFDIESEVLRNIRHRNLIKVISCCSNMDFKALVLEYLPNGSLEEWLYSREDCLDFLQRLNIMIDVALALEYLHHGYTTPVVHCDLKPSNILLDEDMTAHVCDFGISKLLGEEEFLTKTRTLATVGYMAPGPEYGTEGIVSTSGDVYSYGVTLMETFTRKKPTDGMFSDGLNLKNWVNEALPSSVMHVTDTSLLESEDKNLSAAKEQCLLSVYCLGMECLTDSAIERINMERVAARLQKIKLNFIEVTQ